MSVRPKRGYDPRMNERCVYVKCSSEDLGGWRGAGAVTPGVVVEHYVPPSVCFLSTSLCYLRHY